MKLKKPSVKFSFKPNWKKIGLVFVSSIFSAIILSLVLITIPQTERYLKTIRYDLVQAPAYWQKSYSLELEINPQDQANSKNLINQTKDIIYNRLRTYGVETVTIEESNHDQSKPKLLVTVVSNKDASDVERLVGQRYFIQFVTRKDGVNFDDTKNPLTPYDIANYNVTEFTRYYFRTVYIAKLKATSGTDAYFAIYKPWPNDFDKFYNFFDSYAGAYAGISIDGFVNPIMVPTSQIQNSNGNLQRQPFAIALSTDEKAAKVQGILLNSGVIPVNYSLLTTNNLSLEGKDNNYLHYVELSAGLVIISLLLGFIFRKKEFDSIQFLFISSLPIFALITVAKVIGYGVLPYDLFIGYILLLAFNTIYDLTNANYITKGISLAVLVMISFTVISFGHLILFYLILLLAISLFFEYVYPYYIDLIKRSLSK